MCGRYRLRGLTRAEMQEVFPFDISDVRLPTEMPPRFNVAPSQTMPILQKGAQGYELANARWGFLPHWAKDEKIGFKMINARSETVATSPAFRNAFARHRCLVPADGFYEWRKDPGGGKTPFSIQLRENQTFAFAGLCSSWRRDESSEWILTFTIITGEPNALVRPLHDRMPVILEPASYLAWLTEPDSGKAQGFLRPLPAEKMTAFAISPLVNAPRNDSAAILTPA